jgi:hypothetical protein
VQLVVYDAIVVLAQLYRLGIGLIYEHVSLEEQERGLKENLARVSLALQI